MAPEVLRPLTAVAEVLTDRAAVAPEVPSPLTAVAPEVLPDRAAVATEVPSPLAAVAPEALLDRTAVAPAVVGVSFLAVRAAGVFAAALFAFAGRVRFWAGRAGVVSDGDASPSGVSAGRVSPDGGVGRAPRVRFAPERPGVSAAAAPPEG